jgi:hypothetical protein
MLISESYRKLNQRLHEEDPKYGTSSEKWTPAIAKMAEQNQCSSILDYGAGKMDLERSLKQHWAGVPVCKLISYDPAVDGHGHKEPCDLVVCTDVLEHIEPECLDDVLNDIRDMTLKIGFLSVCTIPAQKTLSDGRNAHLIQEGAKWWADKIWDKFEIVRFERVGADVRFVVAREVRLVKKSSQKEAMYA